MGKLSPMMQQYFEMKKDYPDTLLFFRLGDFYEMFFDDARTASRELDLVLTGRDCGLEERAPMCGVPFHSADSYIAKLVAKGYKIAICEQMEDPAAAKGLVRRDVVRVITPGTVIEGNMLDEGRNNYLCAISMNAEGAGLCFADASTGEIHITVLGTADLEEKLLNELSTYSPREILVNQHLWQMERVRKFALDRLGATFELLPDEKFDFDACQKLVVSQLQADKIGELDVQHSKNAVCALGVVVDYLRDTHKHDVDNVSSVDFYDENQYMKLDMAARRNLELTKTIRTGEKKNSLLWVLDKTKTPMGKRLLRNWLERPLMNLSQITRRQNGVDELVHNTVMRSELTELLARISDVERLMTRVVYNTANARELRTLAATIELLPRIKSLLQESKSAMLQGVLADLDSLQDVQKLIDESIVDDPPFSIREGNLIRPGYHHEVDELHAIMDDGAGIVAQIEEREKEKTGIPKLKVGYNRVFGYYIEITNAYKEQAPEDYIRKQTLTNCERYITQELKELEAKILGAKERVIALEGELFQNVRTLVGKEIERIRRTSAALARLDVLCSLASVALQQGYVCPEIAKDGIIHIVQGRHPVVEVVLGGAPFTPNDTYLDQEENRLAIITGPNMAGKSTYMRQIALITLMAQIGSFVPAESAKVSIVDSIFTRVGASDDLTLGQSTFMVEMNEVASILRSATKDSLIILDEIGRGTSTFDGMSIARSVLEYVAQKKTLGAKTLFATHYHELTALEGVIDGVKNYSIAVKKRGDDITFLRRIVRGGADESYGIEVAKLAGVPNPVVKRAKDILSDLESENPKIEMNRGAAQAGEAEPESEQIGFGSNMYAALIEDLQNMDVNTLTPIEAMQKLYELKKQTEQV